MTTPSSLVLEGLQKISHSIRGENKNPSAVRNRTIIHHYLTSMFLAISFTCSASSCFFFSAVLTSHCNPTSVQRATVIWNATPNCAHVSIHTNVWNILNLPRSSHSEPLKCRAATIKERIKVDGSLRHGISSSKS